MEKKFELVYNKEYKTIFVRCGNQTFVPEQLLQKPPALTADVEGKMREILEILRCDVINTIEDINISKQEELKRQQEFINKALAQLLALYPQMASEDFIKKHNEYLKLMTRYMPNIPISKNDKVIQKVYKLKLCKTAILKWQRGER